MKKLILISIFLSSTFGWAQQEIKVDLFDALVFKTFEISFEHYLNEESSIGLSALFNSETNGDLNYNEKKMFTPYFRQYFNANVPWNFFGELFFGINSGDKNLGLDGANITKSYTDGALGIAIGTKYLSKRGLVIDIYGGLGRNLFKSYSPAIVPRVGLNVGYHFQ